MYKTHGSCSCIGNILATLNTKNLLFCTLCEIHYSLLYGTNPCIWSIINKLTIASPILTKTVKLVKKLVLWLLNFSHFNAFRIYKFQKLTTCCHRRMSYFKQLEYADCNNWHSKKKKEKIITGRKQSFQGQNRTVERVWKQNLATKK